MVTSQPILVSALTEGMNDAPTAWSVASNFELPFLIKRLFADVPAFAGSTAQDDGFAYSSIGHFSWMCIDADRGTAVFIIPDQLDDAFDVALRDPLLALRPELTVHAAIYGNVAPDIWMRIGGNRKVIAAQEFLAEEFLAK